MGIGSLISGVANAFTGGGSSFVGPALQIGLDFLGTNMAANQARSQGRAEQANLAANRAAQQKELKRQADRTAPTFDEQRSDTMRSASASLGRLGAFASEAGTSGSTSTRLLNELRFVSGQDLARIDFQETEELQSIAAASAAVETGYAGDIAISRNRASSAVTNEWLGFGTSALQIGGLWYGRWAEQQAATNRVD